MTAIMKTNEHPNRQDDYCYRSPQKLSRKVTVEGQIAPINYTTGEKIEMRYNRPKAIGGKVTLRYNRVWAEFRILVRTKRVAIAALKELYGDKATWAAIRKAQAVSGKKH